MHTFSGKVITLFTVLIMIFNQFQPAAALQDGAQPAAASAKAASAAAPEKAAPRAGRAESGFKPAGLKPDKPSIKLTATPKFVTGDGLVTIHWAMKGDLRTNAALTLQITFPAGYTPTDTAPNTYDAATQTLSLPVTAAAASGQFSLNVQNPIDNAVFPASLIDNAGKTIDEGALTLPKHEKFNVKKQKGSFSARKGQIKVSFGAGALPEDAEIEIGAPAGDAIPVTALSSAPFEINAQGTQNKQELHQFSGDISIDVDYSGLDLGGKSEENLFLYWYDPAVQDWAALPSHADPQTKILHATTTHFSVFDISINDWQASRLPTLDAFQVSTFTGAATYSMPIEAPAGPGGLQPSLGLSYNSQTIDQSTTQTQASWVGMGWSLDTGSIELNNHGTEKQPSDDTWMLNVAGVSTTIVRTPDGYHAADENFMKFRFNADTWTVWDKQGNSYHFEKQVRSAYDNCTNALHYQTYKWPLTRIRNIFGQELTYNYAYETKSMSPTYRDGDNCKRWLGTPETVTTASYPTTILYPNNGYRVRFEREARPDYRAAWVNDAAYHSFERSRLKAIWVEQDAGGPNGMFTSVNVIRKYSFVYASTAPASWATSADGTTHAPLWPGLTWNTSGKTTTLLQVLQYGKGGGGQPLPATTFSYADQMHLTRADNGYGGRVTFDYDDDLNNNAVWYYAANARASQTYTQDFGAAGTPCDTGNFSTYDTRSDVGCINNGGRGNALELRGSAINIAMLNSWTLYNNAIRPGGVYKFTPKNPQLVGANTTLRYGLSDGANADSFGASPVILPADASKADVLVRATNTGRGSAEYAAFTLLTIQLLTSVYRVHSKTISDGRAGTSDLTYTYTYAGAAVNDSAHSASACSDADLKVVPQACYQYSEKYSEFRGHSQVTETGPDGRQTITKFNQDDSLKGRPKEVIVNDGAGKTLTHSVYAYNSVQLPIISPMIGSQTYQGIERAWTTTAAEKSCVYGSNGLHYTSTGANYTYESGYGNLTRKDEFSSGGSGACSLLFSSNNPYRSTLFSYFPNVTGGLYLTGLPARQWITDGDNNTLAQSFNLYDGNNAWNTPPTAGKLTATRAWVNGADCSQVSYGYDEWGNRDKITAYEGYGTASSAPSGAALTQATDFDPTYGTYPVRLTNPLGQVTTLAYDYTLGLPTAKSDPNDNDGDPLANGTTILARYDNFGRLTKLIKPGDSDAAPTFQVIYSNSVQPLRIDLRQRIDGDTYATSSRYYDGLGRQFQTETGSLVSGVATLYSTVTTAFDSYGRVVSQSTPFGPGDPAGSIKYTTTTYDAFGRPKTVSAPDGAVAAYSYEIPAGAEGLTTTLTQTNAQMTTGDPTTITISDAWGRIKQVIPPAGPAVEYSYNPLGQLTDATRAGLTTHIDYDKAGRKTHMSDPDMGHWYYTYNALGSLTDQTDARGCTSTLTYYKNRLTGKTYSGACGSTAPVTYSYDAGPNGIGRRTGMTDGSGFTSWGYDERGRMARETKTIGWAGDFTTRFTYNSADLPVDMTYPDPGGSPETISNHYNPRMLLDKVTSNVIDPATGLPQVYIQGSEYDSAGRMTLRKLGNNTQTAYGYHPWDEQGGRLQTIKSGPTPVGAAPFNPSLQDLAYTYDAVGNIKTISALSAALETETQTFTYDALDRLKSATVLGGPAPYGETYEYDDNGNLETKGGVTLYYDDVNHKHAVTSTSNGNTYFYDANGNQTTRVIGGVAYTLAYDAEGHIVEVRKNNDLLATFIYDGDGKMVKAEINNITTLYVSSAYQIADGDVTKYYPGGAFRVDGVLYYALSDHLGSTSVTTNANGVKTAEMYYTAWGEVRYTIDSVLTDRTYTGQRSYANDFGLMYYNARWYDPGAGRFAQADTIVPNSFQGLDRYAYVNNSPVTYIDPSGHDACSSVPLGYREACYRAIGYNDLADAVVQQIAALIQEIAQTYNIHLSPNDHWEYSSDLYQEQLDEGGNPAGLVPIAGYTPRYDNEPGVYDKNGAQFKANETAAYIGNGAFLQCGENTECLAEIMAHEAFHSWMEYLIDPQNSNSDEQKKFQTDEKLHYEEVFAITTIRDSGELGEAGAAMGQTMYENECGSGGCNDAQMALWLTWGYNMNTPLTAEMMLKLIFK